LQWRVNGSSDDYSDLIGEEGAFQTDVSHIQTVGVTAGTSYLFRVRAHNVLGWGEFSDSVEIVAAKVPDEPEMPVTSISNIFVRISWDQPYLNSA